MNRSKLVLTLFALLVCLGQVSAWHENGHYTIAYIAQEELSNTKPEIIEWVLKILEPLQDDCGEDKYPFLECTSWADKARANDWRLLMYHHFISIPWFDEKAKPENFFLPTLANVTYGIEQTTEHLSIAVDDPYGASKSNFGKSISLRLLMHFVGDVHQPLHASDRITSQMPEGDAGGNLFPIKRFGEKQMDNLHYLWDTVFEDPKANIKGPMDQSGYNLIKSRAQEIMKIHPRSKLAQQLTEHSTPMSWALESNQIAKSFVYTNLKENAPITEDYIKKGRDVCRKRIALAGYRLADKLKEIYENLQSRKTNDSR